MLQTYSADLAPPLLSNRLQQLEKCGHISIYFIAVAAEMRKGAENFPPEIPGISTLGGSSPDPAAPEIIALSICTHSH